MVTRSANTETTRHTISKDMGSANLQLLGGVMQLDPQGIDTIANDPKVKTLFSNAEELRSEHGPVLPRVVLAHEGSHPLKLDEKVTVMPLLRYVPQSESSGVYRAPFLETKTVDGKSSSPWTQDDGTHDIPANLGFTIPTIAPTSSSPDIVRNKPVTPLGSTGHMIALALDGSPKQPLSERKLALVDIRVDEDGPRYTVGKLPDDVGLTTNAVTSALKHQMDFLARQLDKGIVHAINPAKLDEKLKL